MKLLVLALLFPISTTAWAQWTRIASHDEAEVYADLATIRQQGSTVKMWSLYDHRSSQHWGDVEFLSHMTHEQYDCSAKQQRTLYFSMYSRNMGDGQRVYSRSRPGPWGPLPPGSIIEKLWKIACKR